MFELTEKELNFLKQNREMLQHNQIYEFLQKAFYEVDAPSGNAADDYIKIFLLSGITPNEMLHGTDTIHSYFAVEQRFNVVEIPETVQLIKNYAFTRCMIGKLIIHDTLKYENIRIKAFNACQINSAVLPKSYKRKDLQAIGIPENTIVVFED